MNVAKYGYFKFTKTINALNADLRDRDELLNGNFLKKKLILSFVQGGVISYSSRAVIQAFCFRKTIPFYSL